jgi:hypothetical protein
MPPDGYDTVTLPVELIDSLDDYADRSDVTSRADAVRLLLADGRVSHGADPDAIADAVADRVTTPNADDIRVAVESGVESALPDGVRQ